MSCCDAVFMSGASFPVEHGYIPNHVCDQLQRLHSSLDGAIMGKTFCQIKHLPHVHGGRDIVRHIFGFAWLPGKLLVQFLTIQAAGAGYLKRKNIGDRDWTRLQAGIRPVFGRTAASLPQARASPKSKYLRDVSQSYSNCY